MIASLEDAAGMLKPNPFLCHVALSAGKTSKLVLYRAFLDAFERAINASSPRVSQHSSYGVLV